MKKALPVLTLLLLTTAFVISPFASLAQEVKKTPKLVINGSEPQRSLPPFDREAAADGALPDVDEVDEEDENSTEDDEPVERVARVSFVEGNVGFLRAGMSEWSEAVENLPLLAGDQIYVGEGGRAEIQFGRGNYVRLSEKTALTIAELTAVAATLEVTEGVAIVRLERFGKVWDRFEVDTPNAALIFQQDGVYRVNVRGENESEIIIRRGGAEVAYDNGNFKVRDGQRLTIDTRPQGRIEIAADTSTDDWDRWSYDRDQTITQSYLATSPDYVAQYETDHQDFYGVSDLANYGSWISYASYGNCWVPRVGAGWAPYRAGQWLWVPRVGWTWLAREPWGWAPYHYGRWVHLTNIGWAWAPGINTRHYNFRRSYYQWRPALVSFFNCPTPRGNYIGWYPLSPGERWRRPNRFRDNDRRNDNGRRHLQFPVAGNGNRDNRDRDNRNRDNRNRGNGNNARPRLGNGVSLLPVGEFAGSRRPDRSNPTAPDKDMTRYVQGGARAGLPELGGAESGAATVWRRGNAFAGTPGAVTPPAEIIKRPVVTRQRPADRVAETSAPRERRLIGTPVFRPRPADGQDYRRKSGDVATGVGSGNAGDQNNRADEKKERRRSQPTGDVTTGAGFGSGAANQDGAGRSNRPRLTPTEQPAGDITRRRERPSESGDSQNQQNPANPSTSPKSDDSDWRSRPRPERNAPTYPTFPKAEKPKTDGNDAPAKTYVPREEPSEKQQRKMERRQQEQQPPRVYQAPPPAPSREVRRAEKQERRAEQQQQQSERRAAKQERRKNN